MKNISKSNHFLVLFFLSIMTASCSYIDTSEKDKSEADTLKSQKIKDFCESVTKSEEGVLICKVEKLLGEPLIKLKISENSKSNEVKKNIEEADLLSVTEIDLSNNPHITSIPDFIYQIPNLKYLDISNTQISDWDERMCQLEKLETLIGENNRYKDNEVPFHTFCLKNLKILNLSNSSIRYIDEYIGKLYRLQELYMSNNDMVSAPYMLDSLKNLTLVDFSDNKLRDEDLNTLQSCEDEADVNDFKECSKDIAQSFECEFYNPMPFQRKTPFRTLYIDLVDESKEIYDECKNKDSRNCPHFVRSCEHILNSVERRTCMLDQFENLRDIHPDLWLNRDWCYYSWAIWYNDFIEFPERLEYSLSGRTMRELLFRSEYYMREDRLSSLPCWNIRKNPFDAFGFAQRRHAERFEILPEMHRTVLFSEKVTLAIQEGWGDWLWFYDDKRKQSLIKEHKDLTNKCPHLTELKSHIDKKMEAVWNEEE